MNRSHIRALLLLLLGVLIWLWLDTDRSAPLPELPVTDQQSESRIETPQPERLEPEEGGQSPGFTVIQSRPAARPGIPASAELLEEAHAHLDGGGHESTCGPYSLLGDTTGPDLLSSCRLLAAELDEIYAERLGVTPLGDPAATIILFSDRQAFWDFSEQQGLSASGYAAHSKPSHGYTAIWADSNRPDDFAKTLVHELTHLVNRRALGGNLPRWLSEGLADALGDTATLEGIQPLRGFEGAEGQAERLRLAYETDQLQSVERLVALEPGEFDSDSNSYDYEQSTLLVRYLLLDPELGPRLRSFLAELADGAAATPEFLEKHLGVATAALETRFRGWLGVGSPG